MHYQQPPWSTAFPQLVNISQDHPCLPVYNHVEDNCCTNCSSGFTNEDPGTLSKWLDTFENNGKPCS